MTGKHHRISAMMVAGDGVHRNGEQQLTDLERTFLVMAGSDTAFDVLSDPVRLPDYVSILRLEDSTAIDGEADPDADLAERDGAPPAGFLADRRTGTISWARPDHDYAGSIVIAPRTSGTSDVTVRLHVRPDADADATSRVFEEAVAGIRRAISAAR